MRVAWIAGVVALLLAVAALGGALRPGVARSDSSTPTGGITVTGTGTIKAVPNQAGFSFGVHTQSATAAAALGANGALMTKVIAAVEAAGVAKADLQTQQVSLTPQQSSDGTHITGYAADNSVSVTIKDLATAGAVVDAAVAAGANQVSGPDLTRSDQDALYRQALKAAMVDAKARAQAIADGGGVSLGAVKSAVENGSQPILSGATAAKATPIA